MITTFCGHKKQRCTLDQTVWGNLFWLIHLRTVVAPSAPKNHHIFLCPWPNYLPKFIDVSIFTSTNWQAKQKKKKQTWAEVIVSYGILGWGVRRDCIVISQPGCHDVKKLPWQQHASTLPRPRSARQSAAANLITSQQETITSQRHTFLCLETHQRGEIKSLLTCNHTFGLWLSLLYLQANTTCALIRLIQVCIANV